MPRLQIDELAVRLGSRRVLEIERLEVAAGSLEVILGDAGSGKSVLAAALAGVLESTGRVALDGTALQGGPARRRRAGLTAAVRDGSRVAGCTVLEALLLSGSGARAEEALHRFAPLAGREKLAAELLSGGEQQLLQVACAWVASPRVLVLDSPTVGLAETSAGAVAQLARDEAARGCAVIWLEPDRRAAPAPAAQRLVRGRLESAVESESGSSVAPA